MLFVDRLLSLPKHRSFFLFGARNTAYDPDQAGNTSEINFVFHKSRILEYSFKDNKFAVRIKGLCFYLVLINTQSGGTWLQKLLTIATLNNSRLRSG